VWITGARTLNVTDADLQAYATWSGPGGLGATVLSLRGFWRTGAQGWDVWEGVWFGWPLLVIVVVVVAVGLALRWVDDPLRGAPLSVLTVVGLLLGAGVAGPLGWAYRAAFEALPLFEAMREQQKWLALAVMGYAVGFGAAVEGLALSGWRERISRSTAIAVACLPVLVAPTLVWGLGGAIRTSDYPESWSRAQTVMGEGTGAVLFLPWHAYQPFDFTDERTIATPGSAYFARQVLASDAVELPELLTDSTSRRTAYVGQLVADAGGGDGFARLIAPLGIEYVVLADNVSTPDYTWLRDQPGLQRIDVGAGLELYRVLPQGTGRVVTARTLTFDEAVAAASAGALGTEAVLDPSAEATAAGPSSEASGGLTRTSPTRWEVAPGTPGQVVVPEEYSPSWQLDGDPGQPTLAGTIAFDASPAAASVEFVTWRWLRPALAVSFLSLVVLIVAGILEHRRDTDVFLPKWEPLTFG
jgi:hypothetical protein